MLFIRLAADGIEINGRTYEAGTILEVKSGLAHRLQREARAIIIQRPANLSADDGRPRRETRVA